MAQKKNKRKLRARAERDFGYLASKQLRRAPRPRASVAELRLLWVRQGGRCGLTGLSLADVPLPHLDHIVSKSAGGGSTIDNLHFVHPMANHAKNAHSVDEFRTWLLAAAEALKKKIELERLL